MATSDTFECSVITPERKVLECDAKFVSFPAHDGELGILRKRAPLVCKLGIGPLRITTDDGKHTFFIDEGFAQVHQNRLTILTEQARKIDELDAEQAQQALVEARAMKISDEESYLSRGKAVSRAQVQLKLVKTRD